MVTHYENRENNNKTMKPEKHNSQWLEDYLKENNLDKSPIEEIVEIGTPSSLIKRKGEPTTELINTETLTNELNTHLKTYQWMLDKL